MRLYPHNELPAQRIVEELTAQAVLAADSGFDGVMTSEHHGGFAGYLPNPLQVTGWQLDRMATGWAAPCPLLLPLRPVAQVAEEVAWLNALHPDRIGIGVAPGALEADFQVMDLELSDAMPRFRAGLPRLAAMLRGEELGLVANDPALAACAAAPVPVISTAMSPPAARRAAACRAGMIFDGASAVDRLAAVTDAYLAAGGQGPRILIRRVWIGPPPQEAFDRQLAVYRSYTPAAAQAQWRDSGFICSDSADELAGELSSAMEAVGATCLNLRIHVPGVSPEQARDQIARLGADLLATLRQHLPSGDRR